MTIDCYHVSANRWICERRARCTTVLLTQKLVRIDWKPMFSFQSIACWLQNVMTWSATNHCVQMCRKFCVENSFQQFWLSLLVHILSTQVGKVKQEKFAYFKRVSYCSSSKRRVTVTVWSCIMIVTVPQPR